jgi:hypothetical protein
MGHNVARLIQGKSKIPCKHLNAELHAPRYHVWLSKGRTAVRLYT